MVHKGEGGRERCQKEEGGNGKRGSEIEEDKKEEE